MRTFRVSRLGVEAVLCAVLAACGGGGGGGNDKPADVPTVDPIDKYLGTMTFNCYETDATDDATGASLSAKDTWTSTSRESASKALFQVTIAVFDAADCSGTARATHTMAGADTFLSVDGSATVSNRAVDKISGGIGAIGGLSAGSNVVINGIRYPGDFFVRVETFKTLIAIDADQNIFVGDDDQPLDGQGYPTALEPAPAGKKQ